MSFDQTIDNSIVKQESSLLPLDQKKNQYKIKIAQKGPRNVNGKQGKLEFNIKVQVEFGSNQDLWEGNIQAEEQILKDYKVEEQAFDGRKQKIEEQKNYKYGIVAHRQKEVHDRNKLNQENSIEEQQIVARGLEEVHDRNRSNQESKIIGNEDETIWDRNLSNKKYMNQGKRIIVHEEEPKDSSNFFQNEEYQDSNHLYHINQSSKFSKNKNDYYQQIEKRPKKTNSLQKTRKGESKQKCIYQSNKTRKGKSKKPIYQPNKGKSEKDKTRKGKSIQRPVYQPNKGKSEKDKTRKGKSIQRPVYQPNKGNSEKDKARKGKSIQKSIDQNHIQIKANKKSKSLSKSTVNITKQQKQQIQIQHSNMIPTNEVLVLQLTSIKNPQKPYWSIFLDPQPSRLIKKDQYLRIHYSKHGKF